MHGHVGLRSNFYGENAQVPFGAVVLSLLAL